MAREIRILILTIFGSLVAGVPFGFLLYKIFQRIQKKRQALFQKKANLIITETTKQPIAATLTDGIIRPNGREKHALDTLIENHKNMLTLENIKQSPTPDVLREPEIIPQKITPMVEKQKESPKSDFVKELETNLAIATIPWADKLLRFQTSSWDSLHGEGEPSMGMQSQEIIQLYVDIGLANNIVWLSTEIGHRSRELDESYIKLCAVIAERLKRICPI